MNVLEDDLAKVYRHYFWAAFGSALATSIYSVVDVVVVGRYHGPIGLAAMAVIAPVWNIILSLALLSGIGGSILYAVQRGKRAAVLPANRFFAASLIVAAVFSVLIMVALFCFEEPVLRFFGADDNLLPLAARYLQPVRCSVPLFLLGTTIMAFLRNDGNPRLAMCAILAGGVFNVFGDCYFVFTRDMGIFGAGLATVLGEAIAVGVMLTHFLLRRNTLRIELPRAPALFARQVVVVGFPAFFTDVSMGLLTIVFNRQIMRYLGEDALAVYGVVVTIGTFVQCCGYGVGQAAQPLLSANFGAGNTDRIRQTVRYSVATALLLALLWCAAVGLVPNAFMRAFTRPTPALLALAPGILRVYSLAFWFLPLNILSTYCFQSLCRPRAAFAVSLARGFLVPVALLCTLPALWGGAALWAAIPLAEFLVAAAIGLSLLRPSRPAGGVS